MVAKGLLGGDKLYIKIAKNINVDYDDKLWIFFGDWFWRKGTIDRD